ncbi:hypothetical protein [Pseudomonas protegens]
MDNATCTTEEPAADEQHDLQSQKEIEQASPKPALQGTMLSSAPVVWRPLMLEP